MTSVDELFKKPGLPLPSHKRKFETPNAQQAYKAARITHDDAPNGRTIAANSGSGAENDDEDDIEAGPALPPDDEDDDAGDDDEGRFFGTGMTCDAADALDYLDQRDGGGGGGGDGNDDGAAAPPTDERIDAAWVRRLATGFQRKVARNAELRAKYEADPARFMASEADLDAEIKSWSLLTEHPDLYPEFARSEAVAGLVGLLAHENTDIAIGAIEIIAELLDEDVGPEPEQWDALATALLEADLLELLKSNLARLDEEDESDRGGVYHTLAVMEHLASQPSTAEQVGQKDVLLWLCNRIKRPENPLGQNKQYAVEILQVLLQSSPLLRERLAKELDGVDLFLQLLAAYRKRDPPKESHEEEYMENLFDALTCVVDETEGKSKFVEAEGVELMLIMLKESSKNIAQRALRVLDHAVGGRGSPAAAGACEKVIEAAGLKPIFSAFMKKADGVVIEHLLGIFSAFLRLLPGESAARIRTLAKFTEKGGEKVKKLVELRKDFARRLGTVDKQLRQEQNTLPDDEIADRADEWFSRRLDGGLFCLQMINVILAWLIAEDPEARKQIAALLDGDGGLGSIQASLEEQKNGLERGTTEDEDTAEMLETLISFLS